MSDTIFLEKCQAYIDCHLKPGQGRGGARFERAPSVTVSRQCGAGGLTMANALAAWLQDHGPESQCPWTVFHKNLVHKVLQELNLPERLAQYMPEDKVSGIADAVEELLGLHPPSWRLVRQTTETILQLAELGRAIIVGRAGNVITKGLSNVFHVRLVGSMDRRAERIMGLHNIDRRAAVAFIKKSDGGRKRYVRRYYQQDIDDPLLYDLVINSDGVGEGLAAELVGQAILRNFYPVLKGKG
jgi:hypothetical protein